MPHSDLHRRELNWNDICLRVVVFKLVCLAGFAISYDLPFEACPLSQQLSRKAVKWSGKPFQKFWKARFGSRRGSKSASAHKVRIVWFCTGASRSWDCHGRMVKWQLRFRQSLLRPGPTYTDGWKRMIIGGPFAAWGVRIGPCKPHSNAFRLGPWYRRSGTCLPRFSGGHTITSETVQTQTIIWSGWPLCNTTAHLPAYWTVRARPMLHSSSPLNVPLIHRGRLPYGPSTLMLVRGVRWGSLSLRSSALMPQSHWENRKYFDRRLCVSMTVPAQCRSYA